jgi:hypothetical protein
VRAIAGVADAQLENGKLIIKIDIGARVAPIVTALVRNGAEVEEVRKGAASLEEVFLSLTKPDPL